MNVIKLRNLNWNESKQMLSSEDKTIFAIEITKRKSPIHPSVLNISTSDKLDFHVLSNTMQ